jgi:hypothetical protein
MKSLVDGCTADSAGCSTTRILGGMRRVGEEIIDGMEV